MKHFEYLEKLLDGSYKYWSKLPSGIEDKNDRFIKIPEGAEYFFVKPTYKYFTKFDGNTHNQFYVESENAEQRIWLKGSMKTLEVQMPYLKWQRQPENQKPLDDVKWFEGDLKEDEVDKHLSKVDLTLLERQSQYGCFEDVAFVTQGIIALLRKCNYDNMPQPHQMALYMIASKMARLVNGDHNHIDGWHDIGGYSKLIENLIGGENE